jgi:HPt (histidine-containing phosphotransfer) domain-containing protein
MSGALSRLWIKFLPDIQERVAHLESASQSLSAGSLPQEQREAAHAAAHKLAGTLGTFGFPHGTDLARKAELLLAGQVAPESAADLLEWTAELRKLVDDSVPAA